MRASVIGVVVVLASCGGAGEEEGSGTYGGPPSVDEVLPGVAVSGGALYAVGQNLATADGQVVDTRIVVEGVDAAGAEVAIDLAILEGLPDRLTAEVPLDMHLQLVGPSVVVVETPEGRAEGAAPVFAVEDNGFGGIAEPGQGMVGTVYALQSGTPVLPDMTDPCGDPSVRDDDVYTCPHTSILVPNLDIPSRSFEAGFPGLGDDLVEWFAIAFRGFVDFPEAGTYSFEICSDDGSKLFLDLGAGPELIIDNDGTHGMACASGTAEVPAAGRRALAVDYFQGPRYEIGLTLSWTAPSGATGIVPAENIWLFE